jgi:uncharacterized membrane protein YeaQ/YmgE (transglycosylase-associated protein family)
MVCTELPPVSAIVPAKVKGVRQDPGGIIVTIVLGIVGALLGGWLGRVLGFYRAGEAAGFIMVVVGALIVLALYRLIARRR